MITSYSYDALHRVTSTSYNTSSAPAVATTGAIDYSYTAWGALSSVNIWDPSGVGYQYTENYSYGAFNRLSSVTKWIKGQSGVTTNTYTTSYQYNGGSQLSKVIYPSGQQVSVNHDSKGRMQSLTYNPGDTFGYLTGMTYNIAGQITGLTLGNGVVETYGYDSNRMQLASQNAAKPGNGPLMSLAYSYDAAAGQSGTGTTAGNAGQLMAVITNSSINGTAESAAYTYDNLGRLLTSNQTSNGSSAQRRFSYDRWGNRGAVYDAVSGGTLIQNVALEQSGGAPTNRISAFSTPGWFGTYTYDAAGNVTWDGVHNYTYDGANRIASVDGGVTAQYKYDHQNRRVTKIVGSAWTHYIWEGGQVIAEHDGTTPWGAYGSTPYGKRSSKIDYVYAGSRMVSSVAYTHNCTYQGQTITCTTSSTWRYYLSDRLSTRLVLDGTGNVIGRQGHLPFGEDFGASGTQGKHIFTSYERDGESGSDYAVNRQYAQGVGRFMRVDPVSGSMKNPQRPNRYSYAKNEPISRTDPTGQEDCPPPPQGCPGGYWDPDECECVVVLNGEAPYPKEFEPPPPFVFTYYYLFLIETEVAPETPEIGPDEPNQECVVTVTARALNGIGILGYNHMFITLWDTTTNETDYLARSESAAGQDMMEGSWSRVTGCLIKQLPRMTSVQSP